MSDLAEYTADELSRMVLAEKLSVHDYGDELTRRIKDKDLPTETRVEATIYALELIKAIGDAVREAKE